MILSDCGSLAFTDEQVRSALKKRQPNDASVDSMSFGTIKECASSSQAPFRALY